MARARSRARGRGATSPAKSASQALGSAFAQEAFGVVLLGVAAFTALAIWSYAPSDPGFGGDPVANRAGRLGAWIAAALVGGLGLAAYGVVAGVVAIGGRLLLGRGLPSASSRLVLAIPLLLATLAALPPLVEAVRPGTTTIPAGALGAWLAGHEQWWLGSWGALLANGVALGLVGLALSGISLGRVLSRVGLVLGAVAAGGLAGLAALGAGVATLARRTAAGLLGLARALQRGVAELGAGLERGWQSLGVWRAQRERRARVAAQRAPVAASEDGTAIVPDAAEAPPRASHRA